MRFVDKETVTNALASSHDAHMLAIDTSEDMLNAQVNTKRESVSEKIYVKSPQLTILVYENDPRQGTHEITMQIQRDRQFARPLPRGNVQFGRLKTVCLHSP